MKSRTRSRSVATSGLGLKSIGVLSSGAAAGNASCSAAPVAREQLAVLLQQPGQLELGDGRQLTLEDAWRVAAAELRRGRQKELVDQSPSLELAVQPRSALAEQGTDALLVPEVAQRRDDVDEALVADDLQRASDLGGLGLRGGEDEATPAFGEERRVPGQVEPAADDHHQRLGGEAESFAALPRLLLLRQPPVALGPHRPGSHHHRVETGPNAAH